MLFAKLEEIQSQVRLNTRMLQIQNVVKSGGSTTHIPASPPDGVVLPLKTHQQVKQLEKKLLQTPADKQKLVCTKTFVFNFNSIQLYYS